MSWSETRDGGGDRADEKIVRKKCHAWSQSSLLPVTAAPPGAVKAAKEHLMRTSHAGLTGAFALPSDVTPGAVTR